MDWTDEQIRAFADLLIRAREATGLKQYQVAESIGMSPSTISLLERGPYPGMRAIDIWRLQALYGIPTAQPAQILGIELADQSAFEESPLALYVSRFAHLGPRGKALILEVLDVLLTGLPPA